MNTSKFDGKAKVFDKHRPSYPAEFIEYLHSGAGFKNESIIADIGSGTGILTKQLLKKGNHVFSVEPNDDMRKTAEENLNCFQNFSSVNGTAENTGLEKDSVDFVVAAQAFHWFDKKNFKEECKRILKQGGLVVLVWNLRVLSTDLMKEWSMIFKKYCPSFKAFNGNTNEEEFEIQDFFDFGFEEKVFRNDRIVDLSGFIGRSLSSSYSLKEEDENFLSYTNELKECFNRFSKDDKLIIPTVTKSYAGRVHSF